MSYKKGWSQKSTKKVSIIILKATYYYLVEILMLMILCNNHPLISNAMSALKGWKRHFKLSAFNIMNISEEKQSRIKNSYFDWKW